MRPSFQGQLRTEDFRRHVLGSKMRDSTHLQETLVSTVAALPRTFRSPPRNPVLLEAIQKADVLIEAMGWIRQFRDKVTVIKLGGSVMEDPDALAPLAARHRVHGNRRNEADRGPRRRSRNQPCHG